MFNFASLARFTFLWSDVEAYRFIYSASGNLVPRGRDPFGQCGDRDLWPGPIPEVRDSRTSRHSAHAQSQVWQIWLVLVSIYCVYIAIQNRNVVRPGQGSRFPAHDQRDPWGRGCASSYCRPRMSNTGVFSCSRVHSRPQSLRSFWPAAGIESSGSNHFEIRKENDNRILPIQFHVVCVYGACLKWLLPELSIPAAGQKDRRL